MSSCSELVATAATCDISWGVDTPCSLSLLAVRGSLHYFRLVLLLLS
jgi:hypothetical protein